jgi:cytochrome d ubiquinol oxidase subunit I
MAGLGFLFIGFFATALILANTRRFDAKWFLRGAVLMIPLPWIAAEMGWMVAEIGRQPWAVEGVLPTFLGASSLTVAQVWTTIAGFTLLYSVLAVIEVRLMLSAIRKGPEGYTPWQPRRDAVRPPAAPRPTHSVPAE